MLLFHEHHSGMHGVDRMAVMRRIQAEHLHFAIAGGSIGVVKGLSELPTRWKTMLTKSWPILLIVLECFSCATPSDGSITANGAFHRKFLCHFASIENQN